MERRVPRAMSGRWTLSLLSVVPAIALGIALAAPPRAHAGCALIPGTEKTFNATLGATNRPFAAPGESIELRLRPCDASPGLSAAAANHVVTVVFPGGTA